MDAPDFGTLADVPYSCDLLLDQAGATLTPSQLCSTFLAVQTIAQMRDLWQNMYHVTYVKPAGVSDSALGITLCLASCGAVGVGPCAGHVPSPPPLPPLFSPPPLPPGQTNWHSYTFYDVLPSSCRHDIADKDLGDPMGDAFFSMQAMMSDAVCPVCATSRNACPFAISFLCGNREAGGTAASEAVVRQITVDVKEPFGTYQLCNLNTHGDSCAYSCVCKPGESCPTHAVGREAVCAGSSCSRIPMAAEPNERTPAGLGREALYWTYNLAYRLGGTVQTGASAPAPGGTWYSLTSQGQGTYWRNAHIVKTISESCQRRKLRQFVESRGAMCFSRCGDLNALDTTSACYIRCYYDTLLGNGANATLHPSGGIAREEIAQVWASAFDAPCGDTELCGCPEYTESPPSPPPTPLGTLQQRIQAALDRHSTFWNASYSVAVVGTMFGQSNAEVTAAAGANDYAHPETSRLTPDTLIPMGSATKTYSAVIALRLAEQGVISMDEPLMPYVDQYLAKQLDCTTLQQNSYCARICFPQADQLAQCLAGGGDESTCKELGSRCLAECDGYFHCNAAAPFTITHQSLLGDDPRLSQITFRQVVSLSSGLKDYDEGMLIRTTLSSFRDVTPLEYLAYMDKGLYFDPGQGGAYSTNAFSLLGLAIAGIQNKRWYEVDQHSLVWGSHTPAGDRTTFPTRGTCLQNGFNNDPSTMAHQYFSDSRPPRYRPDRQFVDLANRSCLNTWFGGNIAARPLDVARFVHATYAPNSPILTHNSQAQMLQYHPMTAGWGAGMFSYGLGTFGSPQLTNSTNWGLTWFGHEGEDFGSGAPFNYYLKELDVAINLAMTASHDDGTCGMQCGLSYTQLQSASAVKEEIVGIVAEALGIPSSARTEVPFPHAPSDGWCPGAHMPPSAPSPPEPRGILMASRNIGSDSSLKIGNVNYFPAGSSATNILTDNNGNAFVADFVPTTPAEATVFQLDSDQNFRFPLYPFPTQTAAGEPLDAVLQPNCGNRQAGAKANILGGTRVNGGFMINDELTISPVGDPSIVLGWDTFTVCTCYTDPGIGTQMLVWVEASRADVIKFRFLQLPDPPPSPPKPPPPPRPPPSPPKPPPPPTPPPSPPNPPPPPAIGFTFYTYSDENREEPTTTGIGANLPRYAPANVCTDFGTFHAMGACYGIAGQQGAHLVVRAYTDATCQTAVFDSETTCGPDAEPSPVCPFVSGRVIATGQPDPPYEVFDCGDTMDASPPPPPAIGATLYAYRNQDRTGPVDTLQLGTRFAFIYGAGRVHQLGALQRSGRLLRHDRAARRTAGRFSATRTARARTSFGTV